MLKIFWVPPEACWSHLKSQAKRDALLPKLISGELRVNDAGSILKKSFYMTRKAV